MFNLRGEGWACSSLVEPLPSMCQAPGSIPGTKKTKQNNGEIKVFD